MPITSVLPKHGVGSEPNRSSQLLRCAWGSGGLLLSQLSVSGAACQSPAPESETPPREGRTRAPLGQWFSTGPAVRPEDVRPRLRTLPVTVAGAVLPAPSRPRQRCCRTPRSAQDGPAARSGLARHAGGAEGERPCRVTLSLGTPLLQGCPRARSCPAGLPASEFAFQHEPSEGPPRGAGTYCSRALDPSASPVLLPPAHPPPLQKPVLTALAFRSSLATCTLRTPQWPGH